MKKDKIIEFSGKGILIGTGIALGFILLNKISSNFALGLPSLPLALSDYFRVFIITFIAPCVEEPTFRWYIMNFLETKFKLSFWKSNFVQALLFSAFHFLAYGLGFGTLETFSQLFGTFNAVSGLLITAFAFGLLMGYVYKKTNNLLINIIAHGLINGYLYVTAFAIFGVI